MPRNWTTDWTTDDNATKRPCSELEPLIEDGGCEVFATIDQLLALKGSAWDALLEEEAWSLARRLRESRQPLAFIIWHLKFHFLDMSIIRCQINERIRKERQRLCKREAPYPIYRCGKEVAHIDGDTPRAPWITASINAWVAAVDAGTPCDDHEAILNEVRRYVALSACMCAVNNIRTTKTNPDLKFLERTLVLLGAPASVVAKTVVEAKLMAVVASSNALYEDSRAKIEHLRDLVEAHVKSDKITQSTPTSLAERQRATQARRELPGLFSQIDRFGRELVEKQRETLEPARQRRRRKTVDARPWLRNTRPAKTKPDA